MTRGQVAHITPDEGAVLVVGRPVALTAGDNSRGAKLLALPSPRGIAAALHLPWRRFPLVTCIDAANGVDEQAWYLAACYLSDRVATAGRLIAEHDLPTSAAFHPLLVAAGLEVVDATVSDTRETCVLRRARRHRSVLAETRSRLRMVRRVPAAVPAGTAEVDLATGRVTGGAAALRTRTVVRVRGQAVATVEVPGPVTSEHLVPLAEAALTAGGLPSIIDSATEPGGRRADRRAPAECAEPARPVTQRSAVEMRCVRLPADGGSIGQSDVRRLADEVGGDGWLLFVPPACVVAEAWTMAAAALTAEGLDRQAALVGVVVPASVRDGRAARWWLAELFGSHAPADSLAILTRLTGSACAALRADAAARCWPSQPGAQNALACAVARLMESGGRVSAASGLVLIGEAPARTGVIGMTLTAARRLGTLERETGNRLSQRADGRPSGIGTAASRPFPPVLLSAARHLVQAGARRGVL